jgi:hypothetical protein
MTVELLVLPLEKEQQIPIIRIEATGGIEPKTLVREVANGITHKTRRLKFEAGGPLCIQFLHGAQALTTAIAAAAAAWRWGLLNRQMVLDYQGVKFLVGDPKRILDRRLPGYDEVPRSAISTPAILGTQELYFDAAANSLAKLRKGRPIVSPYSDSIPSVAARAWLAGYFNTTQPFLISLQGGDLVVGSSEVLKLGVSYERQTTPPAPPLG